jgi:hypothetical protein
MQYQLSRLRVDELAIFHLNAAEPQTENRSKNGIHPPEWLVLKSPTLGRMP